MSQFLAASLNTEENPEHLPEPLLATAPPTRRLVGNFASVAFGLGAARAATLVTMLLLARLLSPEDLGRYGTAISAVGVFVMISVAGVQTATARVVADFQTRGLSVGKLMFNAFSLTALLSMAVTALAYAAVGPAAEAFTQHQGLALLIRIVAWTVPVLTLVQVAAACLQGMQEFRGYRNAFTAYAFLTLPVTWFMAKRFHVVGALWAVLVVNSLVLAYFIYLIRNHLHRNGDRFHFQFDRAAMKAVFHVSVPLALSNIALAATWWGANLVLARLQGFREVSFYAVGLGIFQTLAFLPNALSTTTLPLLTGHHSRGDREQFTDTLDASIRMVWAITLPIVAVLVVCSWPLCLYFLGPKFVAAAPAVRWMSVAALIGTCGFVFAPAVIGAGRVWLSFFLNVVWIAVFGAALTPMATRYGSAGVAGTILGAYVVQIGILLLLFGRGLQTALLRLVFTLAVILVPAAMLSGSVGAGIARGILYAFSSGGIAVVICWFVLIMPIERQRLVGRLRTLAGSRLAPANSGQQ